MASPDAALHLGPQARGARDCGRRDLAEQLTGTDALQIESWHLMFVARGKVGPFRAEGSAIAGASGRIHVDLTLYDEGSGDQAISSGSAVYRATNSRARQRS